METQRGQQDAEPQGSHRKVSVGASSVLQHRNKNNTQGSQETATVRLSAGEYQLESSAVLGEVRKLQGVLYYVEALVAQT